MEEGENEMENEKKALLKKLENEKSLVDKLKFEEESQVVAIENVFVKIDTFIGFSNPDLFFKSPPSCISSFAAAYLQGYEVGP